MPKIVDWDARRDEILAATWRVIARDGIARATIRAIAREADCSRGILAHYFDDKADILGSALVLSHRRVVARMEARAAGLTGLAALRVIMLEALPLDSERDLEAQIEISFWGRALGNPALRRLQHAEFDRFTDRLRGHLVEAEKDGELRDGVDIVPSVEVIRTWQKPRQMADTERGEELRSRIDMLQRLIEAYRSNELRQKRHS